MHSDTSASLELRGISAGYGKTEVLRAVSLTVPAGSVMALLGPNGAGKTTLLRVAAGLLGQREGEVWLNGEPIGGLKPHRRVRAGLCLIPEGRGVFPALTVKDNLRLAVPPWAATKDPSAALEAFPILGERLSQLAGTMSGGQQQMLALARAYLAGARVVMLDEVSTGLAPVIIDQIFASIQGLAAQGVSLLLVEQYVSRALELADSAALLQRGKIAYVGPPSGLDDAAILEGYLGVGDSRNGHD